MSRSFTVKSDSIGHPFYSEYVYGAALTVWGAMNGENGCSVGDFVNVGTLAAPCRTTALHELISGAIDFVNGEVFYDFPDIEIESHRSVVIDANLAYPADVEARILDGAYTYEDKGVIYSIISEATEKIIVPSVFHALFSDRNFISDFQIHLQRLLVEQKKDLPAGVLTNNLKLKRVRLPTWLKKGIFFRDQGICQLCGKDISGIRSPIDEVHIDHIIPLAKHGSNDPTNFQLTCRDCNLSKGATLKLERARFVPYWQNE